MIPGAQVAAMGVILTETVNAIEAQKGFVVLLDRSPNTPFAEHDLLFMTQLGSHAQLQLEKIGLIRQLQRENPQVEGAHSVARQN